MEQYLSKRFFESTEPPPSVQLKKEGREKPPRKDIPISTKSTKTETLDETRERLAAYGEQNPEAKPFVDPYAEITVRKDSLRPPSSRGINRKRKK